MLSLLFLSAVAQLPDSVPPLERLTPADVVQTLTSAGYLVETTDSNGMEGIVARDGARVGFLMADERAVTKTKFVASPHIGLVTFWIEVPIGEDDDVVNVRESQMRRFEEGFLTPQAHLGRTATLCGMVGAEQGISRKALRIALDGFWRKGTAYAHRHRGEFVAAPECDWSMARFTDAQTLEYGDDESVRRAMASWGFMVPGSAPRPFHPGSPQFTVDGFELSVSFGVGGSENLGGPVGFSSLVSLEPQADVTTYLASGVGRTKGLETSYAGEGLVTASRKVQFGPRVRLGELRRAVTSFVRIVAALPRSVQSKP